MSISADTDTRNTISGGFDDPGRPAAVRRVRWALVVAAVTLAASVLAGLALLLLDPAAGSTTEAALGVTAAVSGLATGALVLAAVIYAQVKNLWGSAPTWTRYALLGLVAVGVARSIFSAVN